VVDKYGTILWDQKRLVSCNSNPNELEPEPNNFGTQKYTMKSKHALGVPNPYAKHINLYRKRKQTIENRIFLKKEHVKQLKLHNPR
jgi:hypothetical protein